MKVYRIIKHRTAEERQPGTPLMLDSLDELEELLGRIGDHDLGDTFSIRVIEMPKEEFENLQEWGGW